MLPPHAGLSGPMGLLLTSKKKSDGTGPFSRSPPIFSLIEGMGLIPWSSVYVFLSYDWYTLTLQRDWWRLSVHFKTVKEQKGIDSLSAVWMVKIHSAIVVVYWLWRQRIISCRWMISAYWTWKVHNWISDRGKKTMTGTLRGDVFCRSVHHFGPDCNYAGWTALKFCTDIQSPVRMKHTLVAVFGLHRLPRRTGHSQLVAKCPERFAIPFDTVWMHEVQWKVKALCLRYFFRFRSWKKHPILLVPGQIWLFWQQFATYFACSNMQSY